MCTVTETYTKQRLCTYKTLAGKEGEGKVCPSTLKQPCRLTLSMLTGRCIALPPQGKCCHPLQGAKCYKCLPYESPPSWCALYRNGRSQQHRKGLEPQMANGICNQVGSLLLCYYNYFAIFRIPIF